MGIKLSKQMMYKYKDGVYRMSRVAVAKHVAQLEADLDGCVMGGNMLHGALSSTQDKVERLEAENEALIKAHWEQMAETDYCYVCGEHGYNHPNKKCLLARKEAP